MKCPCSYGEVSQIMRSKYVQRSNWGYVTDTEEIYEVASFKND
jgi:hypothetical protein